MNLRIAASNRKPAFVKPLEDAKAVVGQPLKLEAQVMAFPAPEIKWWVLTIGYITASPCCVSGRWKVGALKPCLTCFSETVDFSGTLIEKHFKWREFSSEITDFVC
jgi:hypothetical protein